ncbi:ABC transporter ATP-binding protein [Aquabacterium sp.]|uniref:ABC transporter ATP-binding protein n=1 Tax=Aquabacterium sp. TaxID=1872578 RepID=UPI00199F288D|nr:ABC transporter ATP-binding protein [Aquabacterium sp.]MBC7700031.1 ABC transporter ATP-binding protein [Aquabacterium sp.]
MNAPQHANALSADIQAVRLSKQWVLHPISLKLPAGRWTAIVGPNGAGKSTLLRTLAGLQPCDGQIGLQGRPLNEWPAKERARALAWLGQSEAGADDLSALDVVMLGRLPHQAWLAPASPADHAAVQQAMTQTHCWAWKERTLAHLSGGERQRVLLARALAVQAPIVLMDEPLAHLDPPHQADWLCIVRELVKQGVTVVSVLHELNMALQADDLVVMAKGLVRHHGPVDSPLAHAALQDVFDHRLKLFNVEGQWLAIPYTA